MIKQDKVQLKTGLWFFSLLMICLASFPAFAENEYLLGGGDTVNITVYDQPDLSTEARISQDDGAIIYPLLWDVRIAGLTPEAAGKKIASLLKEKGILKFPEVTLSVKDYVSQTIPVMGQVNRPG
ncbi:MAG: polysaccharide export protein EpsE, partial [Gammaproteobacteria bacterium]|nr:polysaccharide export protein EpsE [Gammaproteobacteria bacterium]